ncbi:acyltransferase family protein [Nocardioides sp. P5_E3]
MTVPQPRRVDIAPEFPALDTVRALGALAVLTTHAAFQTGSYLGWGAWGTFLARLDVGVSIFFVLSAFLLARPHLARAVTGHAAPDVRTYASKRVLRIAPAYVVTVVLAMSLFPGNAKEGVWQWISSLFLLDTYVREKLPHGITHMWSLGVEVAFYALLPVLMLIVLGRRRRAVRAWRVLVVLAVMIAISVFWHLEGTTLLDPRVGGSPGLWLPGYLSWFAVGVGLALLHVRHQQGISTPLERRVITLGEMPGTCWTLVAGLLLVVSTPLAGPVLFVAGTPSEALFKNLVYALIGGLIVLSGVFAQPRSTYGRIMGSRVCRHLGHISYGVFCLHLSLISLVFWSTDYQLFRGNGLEVWAITLVASILAAEVLYRLVERPSLRLGRRMGRPSRTTQPTRPATESTTSS